MKNRSVVSIDFGSAYTKVAFRPDWNDDGRLVREIPSASRHLNFCVPSVVARVSRGTGSTWLTGLAASLQIAGPNVRIFRNWKAQLFASGTSSAPDQQFSIFSSREEIREVAIRFFTDLRSELGRSPMRGELDPCNVRVCVPKLEGQGEVPAQMQAILAAAGWECAAGRPLLFEPEANAMGILTRGRNATWVPRGALSIRMPAMFEPGLRGAFRSMREEGYGVLVIDIGAFTTDFGYVHFDTSFRTDAWSEPEIVQSSVRLGVRELDQAVFDILPPSAQRAIRKISSADWDIRKSALYAGTAVRFADPDGGTVTIGMGDEANRINAAIAAFADKVWAARESFLGICAGTVNEEWLTGGGASIQRITKRLQLVADQRGAPRLREIATRLPENAGGRLTPSDREAYMIKNLELTRGGSAVGGCSVFFE